MLSLQVFEGLAVFFDNMHWLYVNILYAGSDGEYQLQRLLLKGHDPTVIPSKDTSKALEVKMDVALRSIQSLVRCYLSLKVF